MQILFTYDAISFDGDRQNYLPIKKRLMHTSHFITALNFIFYAAACVPMINLSWIGAINEMTQNNNYASIVLSGIGAVSIVLGLFWYAYVSKADKALIFKSNNSCGDFLGETFAVGAFGVITIVLGLTGSCMGIESAVKFLSQNPEVYYKQTVLGLALNQDVTLGLDGSTGIVLLSTIIVPAILIAIIEGITFLSRKGIEFEVKSFNKLSFGERYQSLI